MKTTELIKQYKAVDGLKPCPFCGNVPDEDSHYINQGTKWGGILCCIEGPEVRTGYKEWPVWKQDAIESWNTRAADPLVEALIAEIVALREALGKCPHYLYHPHEPEMITALEKDIEKALKRTEELVEEWDDEKDHSDSR